jgi:hypothetical protein
MKRLSMEYRAVQDPRVLVAMFASSTQHAPHVMLDGCGTRFTHTEDRPPFQNDMQLRGVRHWQISLSILIRAK